jgi:hypothetical protein
MNAWMEWIKYSVCTLNKSDCYYWEARVSDHSISIRMVLRSDGMYCMLALFQDATAWGNKS